MINGLKHFSENFRTISVFALILSFLVFGSCPLKKAVQAMLDVSIETEQSGLKHRNSFSSVVCLDTESRFSNEMTLPQRQDENSRGIFATFLLTAFWTVWALFKSSSQSGGIQDFRLNSLSSVPLYVRNRTFIV